jgi:hypothetical protein
MRDYLAKATLVPHAEFLPADHTTLDRLDDRDWNPRETVFLDPSVKKLTPPAEPGSPPSAQDSVVLKTYTPTEIDIDVQSMKGGYVLINDQYDPDWQVQLNGHTVPLLRADFLLRAVEVPPGDSRITMQYVAHYHVAGLNLPIRVVNTFSDLVMLAAWIVAALALRHRPSAR